MARGQSSKSRSGAHHPSSAIGKKPHTKPGGASNALAAAIAVRKQQQQQQQQHNRFFPQQSRGSSSAATAASKTVSTLNLLLDAELGDEDVKTDQILHLVRECMDEAADGAIALSELGGLVRNLAMRSSHTESTLHKQVKAKWGGWEGFVRAHASDEFIVDRGVLRRRPAMMVAEEPVARRVPSDAAEASAVKPDALLEALNMI